MEARSSAVVAVLPAAVQGHSYPRVAVDEWGESDSDEDDVTDIDAIAVRRARGIELDATRVEASLPCKSAADPSEAVNVKAVRSGGTHTVPSTQRVRFGVVQVLYHTIGLDGSKLPSDGLAPIGLGMLVHAEAHALDVFEAERETTRRGFVPIIPPELRRWTIQRASKAPSGPLVSDHGARAIGDDTCTAGDAGMLPLLAARLRNDADTPGLCTCGCRESEAKARRDQDALVGCRVGGLIAEAASAEDELERIEEDNAEVRISPLPCARTVPTRPCEPPLTAACPCRRRVQLRRAHMDSLREHVTELRARGLLKRRAESAQGGRRVRERVGILGEQGAEEGIGGGSGAGRGVPTEMPKNGYLSGDGGCGRGSEPFATTKREAPAVSGSWGDGMATRRPASAPPCSAALEGPPPASMLVFSRSPSDTTSDLRHEEVMNNFRARSNGGVASPSVLGERPQSLKVGMPPLTVLWHSAGRDGGIEGGEKEAVATASSRFARSGRATPPIVNGLFSSLPVSGRQLASSSVTSSISSTVSNSSVSSTVTHRPTRCL